MCNNIQIPKKELKNNHKTLLVIIYLANAWNYKNMHWTVDSQLMVTVNIHQWNYIISNINQIQKSTKTYKLIRDSS